MGMDPVFANPPPPKVFPDVGPGRYRPPIYIAVPVGGAEGACLGAVPEPRTSEM
jgi:hypothetical protein